MPPRAETARRSGLLGPLLAAAGTAALLAVAFRDVALPGLGAVLASADPRWLAAAVLLDGGVFLLKAWKWRTIFAPLRRLGVGAFFSGIAVGALANNVLPVRLDEVVRSVYFGTVTGVRRSTVLGTIVVERLVDASCLALALAALAALHGGSHLAPTGLTRLLGAAAAGACLLALAAALVGRERLTRLAAGLGRRAPARLVALAEGLREGLIAFPRRRRLLLVLAFAAGEWLLTVLHVRCVLRAFGVGLPLPGELALVAAGYLSFAVPAAPGSLGVYELLVKGLLADGMALPADLAMACTLALHALLVVPVSLVGAGVLVAQGLGLAGLRRLAEGRDTAPAESPVGDAEPAPAAGQPTDGEPASPEAAVLPPVKGDA